MEVTFLVVNDWVLEFNKSSESIGKEGLSFEKRENISKEWEMNDSENY